MIMRQSVTAGKTPVGTEVQAKLVVGTLGDGTVFPKNAIFSRKVIESVARPRPNRPGWRFAWIPCSGRMDPPRTNCCDKMDLVRPLRRARHVFTTPGLGNLLTAGFTLCYKQPTDRKRLRTSSEMRALAGASLIVRVARRYCNGPSGYSIQPRSVSCSSSHSRSLRAHSFRGANCWRGLPGPFAANRCAGG